MSEWIGLARSYEPVRAIAAFVAGLDLGALGFGSGPAATGRPAYDPADLLGLYVYGYLQRIRSSRRLEAETHRNLDLIWLLRGLRPDHWTIAAFRREHRARFKAVLREFNLLCRKLELFGAELVAIDGAKFKAVNSPDRHYTAGQLRELVEQIDARIEQYLEQIDQADEEQAGLTVRPTQLEEKLARLLDRSARTEQLREVLAATGADELSLTDPDSRGQKKVGVGYNVQVAVDAKHDLIAVAEVVQDQNDLAQLHPMAEAAQAALAVEGLRAVADAGYHEAGQLEQCEQAGVDTYVPAAAGTAGRAPDGRAVHPKSAFTYEAAAISTAARPVRSCRLDTRGKTAASRGATTIISPPARVVRNATAVPRRRIGKSRGWKTKRWWSDRRRGWRHGRNWCASARRSSSMCSAPSGYGTTIGSCAADCRWCGRSSG